MIWKVCAESCIYSLPSQQRMEFVQLFFSSWLIWVQYQWGNLDDLSFDIKENNFNEHCNNHEEKECSHLKQTCRASNINRIYHNVMEGVCWIIYLFTTKSTKYNKSLHSYSFLVEWSEYSIKERYTSPPSWRAQTRPLFISCWCNNATEWHADLTLVKSTAAASGLHPSRASPEAVTSTFWI